MAAIMLFLGGGEAGVIDAFRLAGLPIFIHIDSPDNHPSRCVRGDGAPCPRTRTILVMYTRRSGRRRGCRSSS